MQSDGQISCIYQRIGETVTPSVGPAFNGLFQVADVDPLAGVPAIAVDYVLRYQLSTATLEPGDLLTIRGVNYRVADDPYRIGDGREASVSLREDD
ncbi:MAG TPA: hypothetical protein VF389_10485 [Woeseiaceae bacterium]